MNLLPEDVERLLSELVAECEAAFHPLLIAGRDPLALNRFLHQIGWDLKPLLGTDPGNLLTGIEDLQRAFRNALALAKEAQVVDEIGPAVIRALEALRDFAGQAEGVLTGIGLFNASSPEHRSRLVSALVRDAGEHLLLRYLAGRAPLVLAIARLVGFIGPRQSVTLYAAEGQTTGEPIRFPMLRMGINAHAMSDAVMLPVRVVVDHLGPEAFGSIDAFMAGVQRVLGKLLAPLLPYLDPGQVTDVTVSVTLDGIRIQVPGVFPAIGGIDQVAGFSIPLKKENDAPADFPVIVLKSDGLELNWSSTSSADEVPLIDEMLYLSDSFSGSAIPDLGIRCHLEVENPANPRASITLASALRLVAGGVSNHIGLGFSAAIDLSGAFSFTAVAEAAPDLVLPILLPGLDGMALVAQAPVIRAQFSVNHERLLRITLEASAFGLRLPTTLARKATRADDDRWQFVQGAPEIRFSLTDSEPGPLAVLKFSADNGGGMRIADLDLLQPEGGSALRVTSDAIFIGLDVPEQGFIVEIDGFDWQFAQDASLIGGIAIEKATVHFPEALEILDAIEIRDATITERGFSGALSVLFEEEASSENTGSPAGAAPESVRPKPLFGVLPIRLYTLELEFVDNLPVAFQLEAAVELPYFDEWVDLTIGIDEGFNIVFKLESTDPEGIVLTKEELLSLTFRSAGVDYLPDARLLRLSLSGGLEPLLWNADGLEWPRLDITRLVVEQDLGALPPAPFEPPVFKFEEAWLDLKDLATLDLFGFHFELNRIGIGYLETTDKLWVDLTGSLRLIEQVPVGLGVEGFRITWPRRIYEELNIRDRDPTLEDLLAIAARIEVKFDGVYLFFGVPQAVEFEGYIRFIKEARKIGFAGDVALRVPASGLALEAGLMAGMNFENPPYPFLYVYFGILLPSGIPLGQSGLALKGAKGLFGLNVTPDRSPEQNPYYDWYKRGPIEGAHPTNKWRDQIWSIAFGAGITITTTDGKILGIQGLLALVIPGPIIFIEGKALVFDGVFPGDGPLKALGYFDGNALTAQFNIEADLELVEGVIDVNAGLEAFFDFRNLANWHLYLGQDTPIERRVRANILKLPVMGWLFEANSYLMLDMQDADTLQARLGVHIGFEPPAVDLVVASATVRAVIAGAGLLTVNPFQFNGRLELDAVLDVQAFGFSIVGVEAAAHVAVEGALPFVVDARVAARVDLPVPDFEAVPVVGEWVASALDWFEETVAELPEIPEYIAIEVPLHWEFDAPPTLDPLVAGVAVESRLAAGGVRALEDRAGVAIWDAPVVPLDARPSVLFDQNMNQAQGLSFGGFASGQVQRFFSGKLAFRPRLQDVTLWRLPKQRLDPALSPDAQPWELVARAGASDPALRLWGAFRPAVDGGTPGRAARRVLDLWTANVFEFMNATLPLSIPADDSAHDQGPTSLVDGLLGADGLRWCRPAPAKERCIAAKDWQQAAGDKRQRPVRVFDGRDFRLQLRLQEIVFVADDLRILLSRGGDPAVRREHPDAVDQPVLRAAGRPRETIKLVIHFPEPVISATLVRPKDSQSRIEPRALKNEAPAFIATDLGRSKGVAPRLGQPCRQRAAAEVTQRDGVIEITAAEGFDCIQILADGVVDLVRVCWVTAAAAEAAAIADAECAFNAGLDSRAAELPVVLAAGSFYKLAVTTSLKLDEAASDWATLALCSSIPDFSAAIEPYRAAAGSEPATASYFFQTAGPPQDLSPYVKWVSPQHQGTGHFYQGDLVIRFNRPYLRRLYPDPDTAAAPGEFPYAIEALLRDAEGRITRGFFHNWTTAAAATLFPNEDRFMEAVAGGPGQLSPPPPDDILEIRRSMLVRKGGDLGAENWRTIPLGTTAAENPKWQRLPDGSVRILATGNRRGSLFVIHGHDWRDCRFECLIQPLSPGQRGAVGAVIGFAAPENHYRLQLLSQPKPGFQLVRVRDGRETVLDHRPLNGFAFGPEGAFPPAAPVAPVRLAIWTEHRSGGLAIQAEAAGARLAALDPFPPAGGAQLGFFARDIDARFSKLAVTAPRQEILPGTRYTLVLTGGEGGLTRLADDFSGPGLGDAWTAPEASWTTGNGLHAAQPGAAITLRESIEDCELVTTLEMAPGDALRLQLRAPDAARAPGNATLYALLIRKTDTGCDLTATAGSAERGITHPIGFSRTEWGAARRFALRVRLIGDLLRVWVFDRLLLDATLKAYAVAVPLLRPTLPGRGLPPAAGLGASAVRLGVMVPPIASQVRRVTLPLARSGALRWQITAGEPVIRAVELRHPALLQVDFTTSRFGSFAALFEPVQTAPHASGPAGITFSRFAADMTALAKSQRLVADARLALLATQARFAVRGADREELESARQQAVRAAADHAESFTAFLAQFGAAYGAAPAAVTIRRLESADGQWLTYLLRSPEPLDPELLGLPDSAPFGSIGRTRFTLTAPDGGGDLPTAWIAGSDGTTVVIYQPAGTTPPDTHTPSGALTPVALVKRVYGLKIVHTRHHHDDLAPGDHLYDRPYTLSRSSHEPVVVSGIALP